MFPLALATGNTMLLKPSERDPGAAMILTKLAQDAGVPNGVLNVVHGAVDSLIFLSLSFFCSFFWTAVNFLCDDHNVKAISFVGSDRAGRHIYHRGTANGKRVQVPFLSRLCHNYSRCSPTWPPRTTVSSCPMPTRPPHSTSW
jgi:malonate-semialdehyde dehydrogenase (acetylating)/methylmalonate-semialdehyde dehydrogenase